ncbi:hypothetical protein VST7929_01236 [Vibrio stylophorae]|uniref:undecaprenyl-diphosphate phosphatase n=1 Tax=Vibrio stylophorae TaxID=659351 RepID=A0ABM8ZT80_9VIBR|nr:bifunctional NUDIX hydrolase/phosphatase PAP2 family protein [Vibrio stylophorae]CAH0533370.1 hypothetical protein VST7929_01236 [Vibrio stylophorae]
MSGIFTRWLGVLLSVLWLPSAVVQASEPGAQSASLPPESAVCVIRHEQQVLMTLDKFTGRYALPGGGIEAGETAQQAAVREVYEETGAVVRVVQPLAVINQTNMVYSCVTERPLPVAAHADPRGEHIVAAWFAPHFDKEIKAVYLLNPELQATKDFRFKRHIAQLSKWRDQTPESAITVYTDLSANASALHRLELPLIAGLQNSVASLPDILSRLVSGVLLAANLFGEGALVACLIPLVFGLWGRQAGLTFIFYVMGAAVLIAVAKQLIAWPRPFIYWPDLQQMNASGFGMPSGHTYLSAILWGLAYFALRDGLKVKISWMVPVLMVILTATARVWLGVHFISDVVFGALFGGVTIWHWRRLIDRKRLDLQEQLNLPMFWLVISVMLLAGAIFTQNPTLVYAFASAWSIALALSYIRRKNWQLNRAVSAKYRWLTVASIGFVLLVVWSLLKVYVMTQTGALAIVMGYTVALWILTFLVFVMTAGWAHHSQQQA